MTTPALAAPFRSEGTGNGSATSFPYTFKISANTELAVHVDGALKVLTTDYSVTGIGVDGGGNVVFNTAPASATKITILRNTPNDQSTDYVSGDAFPSQAHEDAMDKLTRLVQMLQERLNRAPKYVVQSTFDEPVLPDPVTGKYLRWKDGVGTIENADISTTGASASNATPAATSTAGAPGSGTDYARTDHVHQTGSHDHTAAAGHGGVLTNDEHDGFSEFTEVASPATPAANKIRVYAKDDVGVSKLFYKRDDGTEVGPLGVAGALVDHDHTVTAGQGGVLTNEEHDGFSEFTEIAIPANPAANKVRLYAKDKAGTSELFYKNDAGTERDLSSLVTAASETAVQVFTANGTYTKPADLLFALVISVGGGGGSGGAGADGDNGSRSGGGGGGATSTRVLNASTIGATETVTIGAAGAAGTSGVTGGNGGNGGDTSLGTLVVAKGGSGSTGTSSGVNGGGAAGGVAASGTGDVKIAGQNGADAISSISGEGGDSAKGHGFGGRGRASFGVGRAGNLHGGGASGSNSTTFTPEAGAAGAAGILYVIEYKS